MVKRKQCFKIHWFSQATNLSKYWGWEIYQDHASWTGSPKLREALNECHLTRYCLHCSPPHLKPRQYTQSNQQRKIAKNLSVWSLNSVTIWSQCNALLNISEPHFSSFCWTEITICCKRLLFLMYNVMIIINTAMWFVWKLGE